MNIGADGFRQIFACLPTTVAVITAGEQGITTNTVTAVSRTPPMLSVCLDRTSRTLAEVRDLGHFAVNFLSESGTGISRIFASKATDKFAGITTTPAAEAAGSPVLVDDVVAYAECKLHAEIRAGDHSIIVGLVRAGVPTDRAPLMYYRRTYLRWQPDGALR